MIAKTSYASSRWQAVSTAVDKACRAKQPTVAAQNPAQNRAGSAKIGTFVTASWFQEILIGTILWSETASHLLQNLWKYTIFQYLIVFF